MSPKPIINLIPKIEKQLLISLDVIEKKNIYKITNKPTNINELLKELKANIKSKNHWATFYLIQILSERIADFMIIKEKDKIKSLTIKKKNKKNMTLKDLIIEDDLSFYNKIFILEKIVDNKSKDFRILLNIMKLLKFIRNKYMFHVTNYDEYSFIYKKDEMWEKEKHFINNLNDLVKKMITLMEDFDKKSYEWQLLERYSSSFKRSIENYKRSIDICKQKNGRRIIDNTGVYEPLPGMLSNISYVFILFLGKKNLKLFS